MAVVCVIFSAKTDKQLLGVAQFSMRYVTF
jgi:hypothetical protein